MDPLFAKLDLKTSCRALADLLMPRLCIACGRPLNLREEFICMGCEMDFPYTRFWESTHNEMADEFNARIVVPDGVRERYCYAAALFFYNSQSGYSNIPRQLKYNFKIAQGRFFARRLGEALAGAEHFRDVDAVVPVPLHWTRRWQRHFFLCYMGKEKRDSEDNRIRDIHSVIHCIQEPFVPPLYRYIYLRSGSCGLYHGTCGILYR